MAVPNEQLNAYFAANPDVANAYQLNPMGMTPEQFAATHYQKYGINEQRRAPTSSTGALTQAAPPIPAPASVAPQANQKFYRPSITQFMEKSGLDFNTAADLVNGVIGRNTDTRDWNAIMSAADPVAAARQATYDMYGGVTIKDIDYGGRILPKLVAADGTILTNPGKRDINFGLGALPTTPGKTTTAPAAPAAPNYEQVSNAPSGALQIANAPGVGAAGIGVDPLTGNIFQNVGPLDYSAIGQSATQLPQPVPVKDEASEPLKPASWVAPTLAPIQESQGDEYSARGFYNPNDKKLYDTLYEAELANRDFVNNKLKPFVTTAYEKANATGDYSDLDNLISNANITGYDLYTMLGLTPEQQSLIAAKTGKSLTPDSITSTEGKQYNTSTLLKLANQLAQSSDYSGFSGGVFNEKKGHIGFNYDQVANAVGRDVEAVEQVLLDSARNLMDQGITDLSKLSYGDYKSSVIVRPEFDDDGKPTGRYFAQIPGETDSDGFTSFTNRLLTPEEAARIRTEEVQGPSDEFGPATRQLLDDVVTGRGLVYDNRSLVQGNRLDAGLTYAGKGGTRYQITYDEQGKPRFTTTGFSTSDLANIAPLLQFASFVPGLQPFAIAANAAIAASQGNVLGALASLAGMGGYTNLATGLNVANAVKNKDIGALASSLLSNPSLANSASSTMLTDTISFADVGNAANLVMNLDKGNLAGALNSVGSLTGSSDIKVAASAATIITELGKENPNFGTILNATQAINNATSSASNNVNANTVADLTRGITDDMRDMGADTFVAAKRTGASDADAMAASNALTQIAEANETFDGSGFATQKEAMDAAIAEGLDKFTFGGKRFTIDNSAAQIADFENTVRAETAARAATDPEFGDLAGAQAAATARNTVAIGNAEANDANEAAYLAKVRDPSATSFTFDGKTYTISASQSQMDAANRDATLAEIKDLPNFNEAYARARSALGPNQTFEWNGKQYSTATAQERPDLSVTSIDAVNARNLATTTDASRTVAAQTDMEARDAAAIETANQISRAAATKPVEQTSFFGQLYKDLNNRFRMQGEAANEYLRNNPNSPITASVSSAFEAAGELSRNIGGAALALDNKPLADAIIQGGSRLQKMGQSIGDGPEDTKNWNDTLALIDKARGTEKLAVLAGRIMDGKSGLARQVGLELRQEIPALFLGGGLLRPTMIASGLIDTADTGGAAVIDAYDDVIKRGGTHQEGLAAGRKAGAAAAVTEAAIQLTLGKIADVAAGKLDNVISKGSAKVAGEGIVEATQEGGASVAVDLALGNAVNVNKALTQTVVGGAVGKGTAASTTPIDAAQTAPTATEVGADTVTAPASKATDLGPIGTTVPGQTTVQGTDLGVIGSVTPGADLVESQAPITVEEAQQSMADLGLNVTDDTAVSLATKIQEATNSGNDVSVNTNANIVTINDATANTQTMVDAKTGVTTSIDNNTNTTTQTKIDGNIQTTVITEANTNTNTQTVVDAKTDTTTSTTVNTNTNTTTQTTINSNTQTTVVTDPTTNTQTTVKIDTKTGEPIDITETPIPDDWKPPVIDAPVVPDVPSVPASATPKVTSKSAPPKSSSLRMGDELLMGDGYMPPLGIDIYGDPLGSRVTQGRIDPLARVKEAQAELERDLMMNQLDPRLANMIQQRMDPQQLTNQFDKDIGALEKLLRGEPSAPEAPSAPSAPANEGKYYSYGSEDSIDDILGGKAANYAAGGYVEPLKAAGGSMALPLLVKSGGALDKYSGRENFKEGKHVAGEGDGQSDDIPAWLADGEFVFPADVVSALGNGSTKAGTDKLYEMMHNIRDRARSNGPKDLPPPAFKSPLDYLKSSKRSK